MQALTISLLVANMVVVVAVGTIVAAQVKRVEKRLVVIEDSVSKLDEISDKFDEYDANLFGDREHIDEELKKISANTDLQKLKVELKDHISKEFYVMAFRGIKLK